MSGKRYELAGKAVPRVGFGAMQLGDVNGREGPPTDLAEAILRDAVAAGVDHIDTAQFYGGGEGNRRIRAALAPYSEDLLIATKIGAAERPDGSLTPAQKPVELRAQVEENLVGLGVEALDLVYLRRVDTAPGLAPARAQALARVLFELRWSNAKHRKVLELAGHRLWIPPREDGYVELDAALTEPGSGGG